MYDEFDDDEEVPLVDFLRTMFQLLLVGIGIGLALSIVSIALLIYIIFALGV